MTQEREVNQHISLVTNMMMMITIIIITTIMVTTMRIVIILIMVTTKAAPLVLVLWSVLSIAPSSSIKFRSKKKNGYRTGKETHYDGW